MRVAMIVDEERLTHEHEMLARLCVGLIDEGAQVVRLLPDNTLLRPNQQRLTRLADLVSYSPRVLPWLRRRRLERLRDQLERYEPDLVYAMGRGTWSIAADVADMFELPLAVEVWSIHHPPRVSRCGDAADQISYVAATEAIAHRMRRRVAPESVAVVEYGVPLPPRARTPLANAENIISVAILGDSRDVGAYRVMFDAFAQFARQYPQLQGFLELEGPHEHDIWRILRDRDLLSHVSALAGAWEHRPLLSQCDMVIVPERLGRVRTILLEIMAAGVPVVTAADPALDHIIPDQTAIVVAEESSLAWREALEQVIRDPVRAARIGHEAREWISGRHRTSRHAAQLYAIFDQILTGGAYAFRPDTAESPADKHQKN